MTQVVLKEAAKNPQADTLVRCTQCGVANPISELIKEEPMERPYETVTEGFLLCPKCGYRKHTYYMTELLRFDQFQLAKAGALWQEERSTEAHRQYRKRLEVFQNNFDRTQARYKKVFQPEAEETSETDS